MKFSAYFILISYLMAGTGLFAAGLTNAISPVFFAGVAALTFLSFFLNLSGKAINISRFIWNGIASVILTAGLIDYLLISQSLIETSIRFLTLLMVAKLFDLKTNRDYATLYLLTFFQLLAAAASTVNLSFLFALALYILIGIWTLTIFNLKKEWEERSAPQREMEKNILGPYFFLATAGLAVLSFIITLSLFFVIPRMGVGFFPKQTADTLKISGFSEKIDIGELGPVKLDPAIVMRVKLSGHKAPGIPRLYFRGISFDTYNGAQWLQTLNKMMPLKKTQDGIWRLDSISGSEDRAVTLTQTILLEPLETNVLFTAWNGIGVSGNFRNVVTDKMGAFYLPAAPYSRIEYTAYSLLPASPPPPVPLWGQISNLSPEKEDRKQGYREEIPLQYLQLPEGLERVSYLAINITSDKKTPLDKATAVEQYLKKNYRYTLNPGIRPRSASIGDRSIRGQEGIGKNPVEDFLFFTKEGYCEQYANAMAVMLRSIGIPSRLVTGFLSGEWNKFGNYLIIRKRDAHSWIEAYMPAAGWVIFDPTPSAETVGEMPAATPLLTLYIDSLKWRWNRYIVNYTFQDQLNFAKAIETNMRSLVTQAFSFEFFKARALSYKGKDMLIFVTAAALATIILIIATRIVWGAKDRTRWPKTPLFYKDMLLLLAQKGRIKRPGETALEFADSADIQGVKDITDIYYKVRFGGHKPTHEEQTAILIHLKAIKNYKQQVTQK